MLSAGGQRDRRARGRATLHGMKVRELLEQLKNADPEATVFATPDEYNDHVLFKVEIVDTEWPEAAESERPAVLLRR